VTSIVRLLTASSLSNMNENQRMHTAYVTVMHCEKMVITDMFCQRAVIEFLAKGKFGKSHLQVTSWCGGRYLHGCQQC